jgi:hypothetical protein
MRSIAALLLSFALALFPLSGNRAIAAVAGHASAIVLANELAAVGAGDHHGANLQDHGLSAQQDALSDGGQLAHPKSPCGGDASSSACCNLNCHAMAPAFGEPAKVRTLAVARVEPVALPLPAGIRFDGLLRPPRAS